jgi:chemotaxis protein methyltransferase CheR
MGSPVVGMTTLPRRALESPAAVDAAGYARLATGLRELLGIDLDQYRPAQMWRRVNGFAVSHGVADADGLLAACRDRPDLLAELRDMLTINVSEFFRDPEAWQRLGRRIVDRMSASRGFRAWSAGCSVGFEPYSLAMLATELAPGAMVRIVASDVDQAALDIGRHGRYDLGRVDGLSTARRDRFLVQDGPDWLFRPELRAMIRFRQQDLLDEPSGARGFDLILCRNVVIYFTDTAKNEVHRRLGAALRPGGLLFVGSTEAILQPRRFGLVADGPGLYARVD